MSKNSYILGDININIEKNSSQSINFLNAIEINGAFHLIIKPTRVTDSFATVIDRVITNDIVHKFIPYISLSNLTDHYPNMSIINTIAINNITSGPL